MESAFVAGRVLVGSYFLYSAVHHFTHINMLSGYAASKGVPAAPLAIVVSGLLLAVAAFSFLLGWHPRVGVGALVLFLVPVTFMMHAFWKDSDAQARMNDMTHFMKNLALLGAALMFLAIPEPWPLSLASRTRRLHPAPAS
jgi:putative oxidoreductase